MTTLAPAVTPGLWTVDPGATCAQFRARDVFRKPVIGTLPVRAGWV